MRLALLKTCNGILLHIEEKYPVLTCTWYANKELFNQRGAICVQDKLVRLASENCGYSSRVLLGHSGGA